jgi:glycosyltransferase involved in cell wall biosynthesis
MRILLLSAYDAQSHKYWREGMVAQFPEYDWTQLALPGHHFSWRIRSNSLQWALSERATLDQPYDLIIATSMVDFASLKGFVPNLANIPSILYFHENQFIYPPSQLTKKPFLDPKIVTLYAALAADQLVFNSRYNQQTFITGVRALLKQVPEKLPVDLAQLFEEKSSVLPVPLKPLNISDYMGVNGSAQWPKRSNKTCLRLVWAARWEYDKGPHLLLAILRQLKQRKVDFKLCILGQVFRKQPLEFDSIKTEFSSELVQFGFAKSRHQYLSWLAGGDIILSTALHEFQGLAVQEAVQLGCMPVLPNRLVYPQIFASHYLYDSFPNNHKKESSAAADLIQEFPLRPLKNDSALAFVQQLLWPNIKVKYQQLLHFHTLSNTLPKDS